MNPSNSETGMQLPPPVVEQTPIATATAEALPTSPEQASGAERAPQASQAAPPSAIPMPIIPQVQLSVPQPQSSSQSSVSTSSTQADDGDLIEKEWVNRAKQVVERTKDDPYKQTEELTLVKVDYMQKRYGKSLKLNK